MKGCGGNCDSMPHYTHTLTLQEPDPVTDASGQDDLNDDGNWRRVMSIRGRFRTRGSNQTSLGNRESRIFGQIESTVTCIAMTPWTPKLEGMMGKLPRCRLVMGTRKFNVHAAYRIDQTGREMVWELEERLQDS